MANITIRNLDDALKGRLRMAAARHGHSMEEEVRVILRQALAPAEETKGLGSRIRQRFTEDSAVLEIAPRTESPRPATFEE